MLKHPGLESEEGYSTKWRLIGEPKARFFKFAALINTTTKFDQAIRAPV